MTNITDPPPTPIRAEIAQLRAALDRDVPAKQLDKNLLIATWNIRGFGGLTRKWESGPNDSPRRDLHALLCISEIVRRFDVIAVQEVKSNIQALRHLLKALGSDWGLILTDVTKGPAGNAERLAFLFDMRKVQLSGLACEIVIPDERLGRTGARVIKEDALDKQFARTPYAVSFRSGRKTFILITLHVLYGSKAKERTPELKAIAEWLADWATDTNAYGHNLIALGDFNIDRQGDQRWQAFTETGLAAPEEMNGVPRSIFHDPSKPDITKFYDQIAWFWGPDVTSKSKKSGKTKGPPKLTMRYVKGGYFDFTKVALKSLKLTKTQLSWRISDHYPLWAEFSVQD
jgi:endonuclease/exonuclease/phosphatase family metal-dependent hydrolase